MDHGLQRDARRPRPELQGASRLFYIIARRCHTADHGQLRFSGQRRLQQPRQARVPEVHEVLLASVALVTGGPAACIHMQGPYTTAASSEKDLILVQPIDVLGKEHIGKVVIVDPDDDAQEEFLRQVAEALQQGGMRCVVVRGYGAYAVGANLDQAMANAAMLEHSMQILLLARQANLKI